MQLKLDHLITKNEKGIRIQIYSCIIAYLILQLIDIAEDLGKSLLPTFRTSSYIFIYFYIPQDVLTKNCHCRNYY
ncbi:MAG UNVERIFIED_CONTAM: hypothetical protein LVR29_29980 [Microcystis novacekii LVE1205-3]|jgi:hypothetical protein